MKIRRVVYKKSGDDVAVLDGLDAARAVSSLALGFGVSHSYILRELFTGDRLHLGGVMYELVLDLTA